MGKQETSISDKVRIAAWEKYGIKLWRNNTGFDKLTKTHYGLKVGSADWIGVVPMVIEQRHVGCIIGAFFSIETKTDIGRMSKDGKQKEWLENRLEDGCIALVARKAEDVPDPKKWEFPKK